MSSQLFTLPGVPQTLETTLHMPYTLTTGQAAGSFLAGLATHRILGSRCSACSRVVVPAQDVCVRCGELTPDLVETPLAGEVSTWTRTEAGVAIKVRLDGTDVDLLHRYLGDEAELRPAVRVTASWADAPTGSINDLAGQKSGGMDPMMMMMMMMMGGGGGGGGSVAPAPAAAPTPPVINISTSVRRGGY